MPQLPRDVHPCSFLTEQLSEAVEQEPSSFPTHEGNHDESFRPHYFWSLCGSISCEFWKNGETLKNAGFNPNNGLSDFYRVLDTLDPESQHAIKSTSRKLSKNASSPWSIRTKELPTFITKRCNHWCFHACHDSYLRSNVGSRRSRKIPKR